MSDPKITGGSVAVVNGRFLVVRLQTTKCWIGGWKNTINFISLRCTVECWNVGWKKTINFISLRCTVECWNVRWKNHNNFISLRCTVHLDMPSIACFLFLRNGLCFHNLRISVNFMIFRKLKNKITCSCILKDWFVWPFVIGSSCESSCE